MLIKIQIKSIFGKILFELEKENNTLKKTLETAIDQKANLQEADLRYANLQEADLRYANLQKADLRYANLQEANLQYANLQEADLQYANLQEADLINLKSQIWIIPEEGSFIAWKKAANNCIVKIEIPENAKRICNTKNRKCRAEFVKTLEIFSNSGEKLTEIHGQRDSTTIYIVGVITYSDSFDDNIFEDCSHGIHFFVTRKEAENW